MTEEFTCDHTYFMKKCSMCMNELKQFIGELGTSKERTKWGPHKKNS